MVDELPYFFEEVISLNNEISEREAKDMFEIPVFLVLEFVVELNGGLVELSVGRKELKVLLLDLFMLLCDHYVDVG